MTQNTYFHGVRRSIRTFIGFDFVKESRRRIHLQARHQRGLAVPEERVVPASVLRKHGQHGGRLHRRVEHQDHDRHVGRVSHGRLRCGEERMRWQQLGDQRRCQVLVFLAQKLGASVTGEGTSVITKLPCVDEGNGRREREIAEVSSVSPSKPISTFTELHVHCDER